MKPAASSADRSAGTPLPVGPGTDVGSMRIFHVPVGDLPRRTLTSCGASRVEDTNLAFGSAGTSEPPILLVIACKLAVMSSTDRVSGSRADWATAASKVT
jgi:hypothetical protein